MTKRILLSAAIALAAFNAPVEAQQAGDAYCADIADAGPGFSWSYYERCVERQQGARVRVGYSTSDAYCADIAGAGAGFSWSYYERCVERQREARSRIGGVRAFPRYEPRDAGSLQDFARAMRECAARYGGIIPRLNSPNRAAYDRCVANTP